MSTVGIVGVGSIGAVLAEGFAGLGHDVRINDSDPARTASLPYPAVSKRTLAGTADVVVFALPTPTTDDGGDASIVNEALRPFQGTDATIILRSTMPPGTTGRLAATHDLPLVYSPEFLRDRSGVADFYTPDRIVLAGPPSARAHARELVDVPAVDCDTIIETDDYLDAEIGKEAHNAFFACKVSFANQLRMVCEETGADVDAVMDVITADHRNTSSHLDPLLGPYGGKCLPKDTAALTLYADDVGVPTPLLRGVIDTNTEARRRYENLEIDGEWPEIRVRGD